MKTQITILILITIIKAFLWGAQTSGGGYYLELAFLDVGQGDSILITTPNKKHILIDGGPGYEVSRHLNSYFPLNNCSLDLIILTHPHQDHIEGLNRVINQCSVEAVFYNFVNYETTLVSEWEEKYGALKEDTLVKAFTAGESFQIDGVVLHSVWPTQKYLQKGSKNINNTSIVLFLDYGNFEAFLTGDAETDVLKEIWRAKDLGQASKAWTSINGAVEVYKLSHHGSANGLYKPLWYALDPDVTVISVGEGNSHGHPHPSVIDFLESQNAVLKRTDVASTVKIRYNLIQNE